MNILFVMDEIDKMNPATDSSIEIMRECGVQGISTSYCTSLWFDTDVWCDATEVEVKRSEDTATQVTITKKKSEPKKLDDFSLILMRKEPPYDFTYHYMTLLLDQTSTRVLNSPQGLRNANEKLVIMNFPHLLAPTLVSNDVEKINSFIERHKTVVIKPIHEFGGRGIEKVSNSDSKKNEVITKMTNNGKDYVLVQQFIETVYEGDKRIFLLNGELLGAIKRVPQQGDFRANMVIGGKAQTTELTTQDHQIISTIGPYLKEQGLVLAGVDVIDGKLIEINVTCPTGLVPINQLYNQNVTSLIVEYMKAQKA